MFYRCVSVHRGEGVCLSACWDARLPPGPGRPPRPGRHPLDQADTPLDQANPLGPGRHPPPPGRPPDQADTPPDQADPPGSRLQHTVYERPVRILLECILVSHTCILFICFSSIYSLPQEIQQSRSRTQLKVK